MLNASHYHATETLPNGLGLVLLHSDYDSLAWDLRAMSGSG